MCRKLREVATTGANSYNAIYNQMVTKLDTARVYTTEQVMTQYGRTNVGFNSAAVAAITGGINNLLNQPVCGCK